jgi:hypothetical protein
MGSGGFWGFGSAVWQRKICRMTHWEIRGFCLIGLKAPSGFVFPPDWGILDLKLKWA